MKTPRTATTFGPAGKGLDPESPEPPEPDGDGWEAIGGGLIRAPSKTSFETLWHGGCATRWTKWARRVDGERVPVAAGESDSYTDREIRLVCSREVVRLRDPAMYALAQQIESWADAQARGERVLEAVAGESSAWDASGDPADDEEPRGESCGDATIQIVEIVAELDRIAIAEGVGQPARIAENLWRVADTVVAYARLLADDATGAVSCEALRRWALGQWRAEVEYRPLENIYRPVLDSAWRQVYALATGGAALPYPAHAELVAGAAEGKP